MERCGHRKKPKIKLLFRYLLSSKGFRIIVLLLTLLVVNPSSLTTIDSILIQIARQHRSTEMGGRSQTKGWLLPTKKFILFVTLVASQGREQVGFWTGLHGPVNLENLDSYLDPINLAGLGSKTGPKQIANLLRVFIVFLTTIFKPFFQL